MKKVIHLIIYIDYFKFKLKFIFILTFNELFKNEPELLIKRIDVKLRDTEYTFLNILNEYNIPSNIYYEYLCGIDEYKLKNVWNHVISRWNNMKLALKSNSDFKNSEYFTGEYRHHQITL